MINSRYFLYFYVILIILNGANTYDNDGDVIDRLYASIHDNPDDDPKFGIQNTSVRFIRFTDSRHPDSLCFERDESYQAFEQSPIPADICTGNIKCGLKVTGSYRATLNVSVPEGSQCTYGRDPRSGCYKEQCIILPRLVS